MSKTKTSNGLGAKGWGIIILSFLTVFVNSSMTSDSLNIVIPAFAQMRGLNATVLYSLATAATICGVIGSIILGKIMQMKTARMVWGLSMFATAVFAIVWGQAANVGVYSVGYLVSYTTSTAASMLLSYQVIANWFPKKRGLAMGWVTAGYPLSAATTSAFSNALISKSGISSYYILMAVICALLGIIIIAYVRDFPEEKGAYPDNNRDFDFEHAKREHEENLRYMATSKWTVKKCLTTVRTWHLWFSIGVLGFLSMGIMSNFVNKFLEYQYEITEIIMMLAIAGLLAIPGSIFIGWLDVKIGTKKSCILTYILGILAIVFNLTHIHALHYCSLPILALMLGGASNFLVSCTSAVWGRYDFQSAFRVIQPLNSLFAGVGITVVGVIGTNVSYTAAYITLLVFAIVGFIAFIALKVSPIDSDVR